MIRTDDSRCRFDSPLEGTLAGFRVHLTELGRYGAQIEHETLATVGKRSHLSFRAGGEIFLIGTDVVQSRVDRERSIQQGRLVYRSEVEFGDLSEANARHLDQLVQVLEVAALTSPGARTEALQFEIVSF